MVRVLGDSGEIIRNRTPKLAILELRSQGNFGP